MNINMYPTNMSSAAQRHLVCMVYTSFSRGISKMWLICIRINLHLFGLAMDKSGINWNNRISLQNFSIGTVKDIHIDDDDDDDNDDEEIIIYRVFYIK